MENKLAELGRRLWMLLRRRQFDAGLEEELRLHRELREQEQVQRGLSPKEAYYAVQRRFGNDLVLRQESRDMWGWNWLENLAQDIRYGLRMLAKNPGFTVIAVLTLALGIGANTAVFSVTDAVLFRALPYRDSDKLDIIAESSHPNDTAGRYPVSPADFLDWRDQNRVFEQIGAYFAPGFELTGTDQPEQVPGAIVSASILLMLGVQPILGRGFSSEDDRPGARV